jgi:formylglycine-generating enzyme required for sulfatase activity
VGFSQDDRHPAVCVSHNDATRFASWMSQQGSGKRFRLPTEAEREYAARSGGKKEKYAGTSSESDLERVAWYNKNSGKSTHPVGEKAPNGLGLYDMTGNAWEWCSDWYGETYFGSSSKNDPPGPASGTHRVLRGGAWYNVPVDVRTSKRSWFLPDNRGSNFGFRLLSSPHD